MVRQEISILNRRGLHARAAARVVKRAALFECSVYLVHDQLRCNARSILDVMEFGAEIVSRGGPAFQVETDGSDEAAAASALATLFLDRFGEDE